nr:hypothetical protein [Sinorhizobium sp. CCBAU 05631]
MLEDKPDCLRVRTLKSRHHIGGNKIERFGIRITDKCLIQVAARLADVVDEGVEYLPCGPLGERVQI